MLVDLVSAVAVGIIIGNELAVLPTRSALSWMEILSLTLPTNVSALNEYLPTTELTGTILIIVYDCINSIISMVRVYVWLQLA